MVTQIIASGSNESVSSNGSETFTPKEDADFLSKILEQTAEIKRAMAETPVGLDAESKQAIDDKLREKVTALGHLIGTEAERRIGFSHETNLEKLAELEELYIGIELLRSIQATVWNGISEEPVLKRIPALIAALRETIATEKSISVLHYRKFKLNKFWFQQSPLLAQSYRSVLSEIRPLGGKLKVRKGSSFFASKILKATVEKTFPADWIETSNKAKHLLALRFTRHGGFYEPKPSEGRTDEKGHLAMVDTWEAPLEDVDQIVALLSECGNPVWVTDAPPWEDDGKLLAEINYYGRFAEGVKVDIDGNKVKPHGKDWFFGYAPGENEDFPQEKTWYQHGYVMGSEKDGLSPVLNISCLNSFADQTQTAYHEFMHHMQNLLPETVNRLERAYSLHRTTTDGVRNPLMEIEDEVDSKNKSEVFYRDGNFVDPYMGREYPYSNDLEILTTGAESLFARAYGSLLGFHGWQADIEHRNFTLGVLAVA